MIVLVGLSHHTSPIEIRERAVLGEEANEALLAELASSPLVAETFIVSTCNRMEIVVVARLGADAPTLSGPASRGGADRAAELGDAVVRAWGERAPAIEPHLYRHADHDAVAHLFRVTASLDSMVLGEPQILGQIKAAVERARERKMLGPELERVFTAAFRAAKRVRTETALGAGQVSVPSIAVELAKQIFGDLSGHRALLVGTGDMGETVAGLLRQAGARLQVMGRNVERVEELRAALGAESRPLSELETALGEVDVIIGTTSAPHPIIGRAEVGRAMKRRRGKSLFFIDLAVPRDVDAAVGELENVFLYNIDDLAEVVARSLASREREAERAEAIVSEELVAFERRRTVEQVTPAIAALRRRLSDQLTAELERSLHGRLKHLGAAEREALDKMLEAAVKKLIHQPSTRLRELAEQGDREALEGTLGLLEGLFGLELPLGLSLGGATLERSPVSTKVVGD